MRNLVRIIAFLLILAISVSAEASSKHSFGHQKKTYHTYIKKNHQTGHVYVGRTSGVNGKEKDIARRDAHHHMNKHGYGPATPLKSSTNKNAIRGYEQQMIDKYRAAGNSGNNINGISKNNKKRQRYMRASKREFSSE